MTIIGIDPGMSGGIVAMFLEGLRVYGVYPMPKTEKDISNMLSLSVPEKQKVFAYIEKVHAFPGQGVSSTFKFGKNYGFLRGCLISLGIPFEEVLPRTWQKEFKMSKDKNESNTEWKNRLKGKAQQLFPNADITLKTCDALLIAEYGRRLRSQ